MGNYIIYKITNQINGKVYIGRTKTTLAKRWGVHKAHAKYWDRYKKLGCTYLHRSMRKHGIENFTIEVIDHVGSFGAMVALETHYIKQYGTLDPKVGYNLVTNTVEDEKGTGLMSPDTRSKISWGTYLRYDYPRGVTWDKSRNKWCLTVAFLDQVVNKRFSHEQEAKDVADRVNLYWRGDQAILYSPDRKAEFLSEDLGRFYQDLTQKRLIKSAYKGVTQQQGKWCITRVPLPSGDRLFVGSYETPELAAIVYDKVLVYLWGDAKPLNMPEVRSLTYAKEGEEIYRVYSNPNKQIQIRGGKSSQYRGVNKRSPHTWEMSLGHNKIRYREMYLTELEAAQAYDYYVRSLGLDLGKLNFPDAMISSKPEAIKPDQSRKGYSYASATKHPSSQ